MGDDPRSSDHHREEQDVMIIKEVKSCIDCEYHQNKWFMHICTHPITKDPVTCEVGKLCRHMRDSGECNGAYIVHLGSSSPINAKTL